MKMARNWPHLLTPFLIVFQSSLLYEIQYAIISGLGQMSWIQSLTVHVVFSCHKVEEIMLCTCWAPVFVLPRRRSAYSAWCSQTCNVTWLLTCLRRCYCRISCVEQSWVIISILFVRVFFFFSGIFFSGKELGQSLSFFLDKVSCERLGKCIFWKWHRFDCSRRWLGVKRTPRE